MTVVVKIGGARAVDPAGALTDVATLVDAGEAVVVVHGGSTAVDETLEALGEEPTYVETPGGVVGRFTDERTMDVFKMVMPGKLNTDLVEALQNEGVDAVGLSGLDGQLLTGPRKSAVRVLEDGKKKIKRGDHSGKIESVNTDLLETLFDGGYVPVVSVPMLGKERSRGRSRDDSSDRTDTSGTADGDAGEDTATLSFTAVNADADRAAAAIAGAVGGSLVLLTDVDGIYVDPDDPSTLINGASTPDAFEAVRDAAEGFMTKKVMAAEEALSGGAESVVVANANADQPVTSALDGEGTTLAASVLEDAHGANGAPDETEVTNR